MTPHGVMLAHSGLGPVGQGADLFRNVAQDHRVAGELKSDPPLFDPMISAFDEIERM
jgi:hypothetical protein